MNLHDVIHAPTRPAWTLRLAVFLLLIAVAALLCQLVPGLL
jgi:hypothetical protein